MARSTYYFVGIVKCGAYPWVNQVNLHLQILCALYADLIAALRCTPNSSIRLRSWYCKTNTSL